MQKRYSQPDIGSEVSRGKISKHNQSDIGQQYISNLNFIITSDRKHRSDFCKQDLAIQAINQLNEISLHDEKEFNWNYISNAVDYMQPVDRASNTKTLHSFNSTSASKMKFRSYGYQQKQRTFEQPTKQIQSQYSTASGEQYESINNQKILQNDSWAQKKYSPAMLKHIKLQYFQKYQNADLKLRNQQNDGASTLTSEGDIQINNIQIEPKQNINSNTNIFKFERLSFSKLYTKKHQRKQKEISLLKQESLQIDTSQQHKQKLVLNSNYSSAPALCSSTPDISYYSSSNKFQQLPPPPKIGKSFLKFHSTMSKQTANQSVGPGGSGQEPKFFHDQIDIYNSAPNNNLQQEKNSWMKEDENSRSASKYNNLLDSIQYQLGSSGKEVVVKNFIFPDRIAKQNMHDLRKQFLLSDFSIQFLDDKSVGFDTNSSNQATILHQTPNSFVIADQHQSYMIPKSQQKSQSDSQKQEQNGQKDSFINSSSQKTQLSVQQSRHLIARRRTIQELQLFNEVDHTLKANLNY